MVVAIRRACDRPYSSSRRYSAAQGQAGGFVGLAIAAIAVTGRVKVQRAFDVVADEADPRVPEAQEVLGGEPSARDVVHDDPVSLAEPGVVGVDEDDRNLRAPQALDVVVGRRQRHDEDAIDLATVREPLEALGPLLGRRHVVDDQVVRPSPRERAPPRRGARRRTVA